MDHELPFSVIDDDFARFQVGNVPTVHFNDITGPHPRQHARTRHPELHPTEVVGDFDCQQASRRSALIQQLLHVAAYDNLLLLARQFPAPTSAPASAMVSKTSSEASSGQRRAAHSGSQSRNCREEVNHNGPNPGPDCLLYNLDKRVSILVLAPELRFVVPVEIGGVAVHLRTDSAEFHQILLARYGGFLNPDARKRLEFDVVIRSSALDDGTSADEDVNVRLSQGKWLLSRGDFRAEWEMTKGLGWVQQSANPYSIDTLLRIVHSLVLAQEGGFLLHAASVVRHGRAFLFSGISGAGKTTISRLAPHDATLLTDEISYVRRGANLYQAYGTPFAGELAKPGENISAPIECVYLLDKDSHNHVEPVTTVDAVRMLMRNTLFFADDRELVKNVFYAVTDFVSRVPVRRLAFYPDERVWELVRL